MTYSLVPDVRREFKSVLEAGTVITDDKIIEFQLQMYAVINSIVGIRYQIPVTGTAPVNQQDTLTFAPAGGGGEVFTVTTEANGATSTYSYTSIGADSATVVRDAVLALINADKQRLIEPTTSGAADITTISKVLGFAITITVTANVTLVNSVAAVFGSMGLRVLRKIETELTACKIASILRTKVADKLKGSGVRQDIKDGSCEGVLMKQLQNIATGQTNLDDAIQETSGTGLGSHNQATGYEGNFKVDVRQW